MGKQKKSGAILCPSCGRLINVNAKECIHCGRKYPGMGGLTPYLQKFFGNRSSVTPSIITACVFLYVLSLIIDPMAILRPQGIFGILAPSMKSLDRLGMTGTYAMAHGRWWTCLTAIYLHGGLLHILFNMLWIRQLGSIAEEFFGTARFVVIFTISGALGFVVSNIFRVAFTIGASGSIFGLVGALIYYGQRRGGTFGAAIYRQMGTWAIVLFIFGFMMPGINNFAHAGGFIAGYLSAMVLGFSELKRESTAHRLIALMCLIITIFGFLIELIL